MTHALRSAHSRMEVEAGGTSIDEMADKHLFATEQPLHISIASTERELEDAYRLVYKQFMKQGYQAENESGIRFLPHFALPTSHTLIAKTGDNVVGTLTLVRDGALGLPMEKLYPNEVAVLRQSGAKIAEVSCLATRRTRDLPAVLRLFYAVYGYALHQYGITDLCVVVSPSHQDFYKHALLLEQIGPMTSNALCNNVKIVAMRLNLPEAQQRFQNTHSMRKMLGRFFLAREDIQRLGHQLKKPSGEDLSVRGKFALDHINWPALDANTAQRLTLALDGDFNDGLESHAYLKTA